MNYHHITKDDMLNGEGLRVVLWVSGCGHQCPHCHNQQTWSAASGIPFDDTAKIELFDTLSRDYISGITFSGGDPLFPSNRTEIEKLINEIHNRFPQKTIWLYTGYCWKEICELPLISMVDVVVDGRYVHAMRDSKLRWCGSSNQHIIDVQRTLAKQEIVLYPELNLRY